MITLIFTGLLVALAPVDAKQLLAQTLNNYANAKGLEVNYTTHAAGLEQAEKSVYYVCKGNTLYESPDEILLVNEKYVVNIKTREKKITVVNRVKNQKQATPVDEFARMSKALDSYKLKATEQGNVVSINVENDGGIISNVVYQINKSKGTILKMEYGVRTSNAKKAEKTVVEYTHTDFNKKFSKDFFSETKLVKKKGKEFVAGEKYKGYKVIDLTN